MGGACVLWEEPVFMGGAYVFMGGAYVFMGGTYVFMGGYG